MSPLREVLTRWSIDGRPLARPATLVRRFGVWPLMMVALLLTTVLVAIGFGRDEAADFWRRNA